MGEMVMGTIPFSFAPVDEAKDIQVGETISFRVDDNMKAFEVMNKGVDITLRSLDLTMIVHVSYKEFRQQRNILRGSDLGGRS